MTELEIKRKAAELLQKERYQEAISEYEKLLERLKKPNPAILNLIGDIHVKQGDYQKGFECYIQASRSYADEGLFHNGIAVSKKILRLDTDQTEVYGMLGQLYAHQGLGMDCMKFLTEYSRRKDDDNEYPAALASFAEACDILVDFPEIHAAHGDMLERVERMDDAAACYDRAAAAYAQRSQQAEAEQFAAHARRLRGEEGPAGADATGVQELMSLRSLDEEPARASALSRLAAEEPWAVFDPSAHPNLPPPPPLPPRPDLAPAEPLAPAAVADPEPAGLEIDAPPAAPEPGRPVIQEIELPMEQFAASAEGLDLEDVPMPSESGVVEVDLAGLPGVVLPPERPEEAAPEAPAEDAPGLTDFFESGATEPAEESEHAVIVGDDFELVREGGDVYEVIKDFQDATAELLDLDDWQAHYDLGTTYMEMELFDEAAMEFEISSKGPDFALPSQEMLGYCFLRKGQIDLAIRELKRGLEVEGRDDRDKLGLLYNLGIACRVVDQEDEAIGYFRRILEIDPDFRDTRNRLERLVENST